MAKSKAEPAERRVTLSAKIKEEERDECLASARDKGYRNLTAKEKRAIEEHQRDVFLSEFENLQKTFVAQLLDTTLKVIKDMSRDRGLPWPKGARDKVDGYILFRYIWRFYVDNPNPGRARDGKPVSDETLLVEGASRELKDQLVYEQIQDRRLKNMREQVRLQHLTEAHMPTEKVREEFAALASTIAKRRETLERMITKEPYRTIVSQAFEDMADDAHKRGTALMDLDAFKEIAVGNELAAEDGPEKSPEGD